MSEKTLEVAEKRGWTIRPMKHEDIDVCLDIWSQVELTEAYQTVASGLSVDPSGFYVAELNDTGELIGMCVGTMTRSDTAFMGFYAVKPRYQKIGIGRELWSTTFGRLDASINVGLYGVPAMFEKYKKSGFGIEDATRMIIFESERGAEDKLNIEQLKDIDDLAGCRLEWIDNETGNAMFKKLVEYDHSVQRFSREKLLTSYLRVDDAPRTVAIVKDNCRARVCSHPACVNNQVYTAERKSSCWARPSQESIIEDQALSTAVKSSLSISTTSPSNIGELSTNRITSPIDIPSINTSNLSHFDAKTDYSAGCYDILGYGCIRHDNNSGGMVGPIYADSAELCEVILKNLLDGFELKPGSILSVMALSSNKQACKILNEVGLNEVEQCSRLFTKFVPAASFSKIYYIHSPNFTLF